MSSLDEVVGLLAPMAMEDPFIKIIHTAAMHVKIDNVEIAFNDEFAAGGWDASKRKEVAKALRSKGKTSKAAIHRARPCASLPPDEKTEASSKASPIEDVQVLVGNTEHDNVWKDYCALTASVSSASKNILKGSISNKRLSLAIRTVEMNPKTPPQPLVTSIALTPATLPTPPLFEVLDSSLSRRHPGIIAVDIQMADDAEGEMEKTGGEEAKNPITRRDKRAQDNNGFKILLARAGEWAPALTNIGLILPSKELLPPFATQVLRAVDGSSGNIQPSSGGTPHVYLCHYRQFGPMFKKLNSVLPDLDEKQKQSVGFLSILLGMALTTQSTLIEFALSHSVEVIANSPEKVRSVFTALLAAQAPHFASSLDKTGRRKAEEFFAQIAWSPDIGGLSLDTRTRMAMGSLLLRGPFSQTVDPTVLKCRSVYATIRLSPNNSSRELGEISQGEQVVPLDFQNGWIRHPRGWSLAPLFVNIRDEQLPYRPISGGLLAMSASSIRSAGVNAQGAHSQTSGATGEMKSKSSRGGGISGLQTVFPDAAKSSISAIQKPNQVSNSSYATDKGLSALVSRLIDDIRTAGKRKGSFGIGGGETLCEGKKAAGDKPAWARAEIRKVASSILAYTSITYSFCDEISKIVELLLPKEASTSAKLAVTIVLCLAKQAALEGKFSLLNPESPADGDMRKMGFGVRCVQMLTRLLDASALIFNSYSGGRILLRRILLPLLAPLFSKESFSYGLTAVSADLFLVLYRHYRVLAKGQIAVLLREGIFTRITRRNETNDIRSCILQRLLVLLQMSDTEVVELYYNFDSEGGRAVVNQLIKHLTRISLERIDEKHVTSGGVVVAAVDSRRINTRRGSLLSPAGMNVDLRDPRTRSVKRYALECIREIVWQMCNVSGVHVVRDVKTEDRLALPSKGKDPYQQSTPGSARRPTVELKRRREGRKSLSIVSKEERDRQRERKSSLSSKGDERKDDANMAGSEANKEAGSVELAVAKAVEETAAFPKEKVIEKALGVAKKTYQCRLATDQETKEKAGKAVKRAVKYLRKYGVSEARAIADFLWDNSHRLPNDQIAELLATGEEKEHEKLREAYSERIDLTHLDFVPALRLFLGDCGILIINLESAKVVRMMELFGKIYLRDNPHSPIRSEDAAHTLASMIMGVHTAVWNVKARKQNAPPSAKDFASFLRGSNVSVDPKTKENKEANFPFTFLMRQYADICAKEMKTLTPGDGKQPSKEKDASGKNNVMSMRSMRKLRACFRRLDVPVESMWKMRFRNPDQSMNLAKSMLENMYAYLWRVTNSNLRASDKMDGTHLCLEIVAVGCILAIHTSLGTYFQGFLELLAERQFLENEFAKDPKIKTKARSVKDLLKRGVHMHRQTWFKQINAQYRDSAQNRSKKLRAIKQVLLQVSMCKTKVRERKRLEALRVLQAFFGHRIFLKSAKRVFLMSARLVKKSDRGQQRNYTFFLFNDLLIYAAGSAPYYKVHQTLHLSLAHIQDNPGTKSHKVLSPQKSFSIEYPDFSTKRTWMDLILRNIEIQKLAHQKHAQNLKGAERLPNERVSTTPDTGSMTAHAVASSGESEFI
mmetsp:Transcript_34060/g.54859  ORF Transcript_34060/g.54859 Transcript_34060/m.54859 type:complete len:1577 (-) Transcript_34060:37-4767(-)